MRELHLSDEAVAAYADGVLGTAARERARRHTESCAECHHAVAVQREAVWALRAAPAPALPSSLLDRLRDVPATTPVHRVPAGFDDRGTPMFAAFGTSAGFVPSGDQRTERNEQRTELRAHRTRNFVVAAASLAVMGSLTGTALADTGSGTAAPAAPLRPPTSVTPTSPVHVEPAAQFARAFAPLRP